MYIVLCISFFLSVISYSSLFYLLHQPYLNRSHAFEKKLTFRFSKHPSNAVTGKLFSSSIKRKSVIPHRLVLDLQGFNKKCSVSIIGVTTTIKASSACVDEYAKSFPVIVVGDVNSQGNFKSSNSSTDNVEFLSLARQTELFPALHQILPMRHFSRKNIGYMRAIQRGACWIWDFDDDNFSIQRMDILLQHVHASFPWTNILEITSNEMVANPYLLYGSPSFIWPRGYPLEYLSKYDFPRIKRIIKDEKIDVVQIMQSLDPDVDANWRLEYGNLLPMKWNFPKSIQDTLLAVDIDRWVPFNAQSTLLSNRVVALSMLPHTVHGRVADIWRSYIMQYLMKHFSNERGSVAFSGNLVEHRRNAHSFMADRQAELQMVEQVSELVKYLDSRPVTGNDFFYEFVYLYNDLFMRGFIEEEDVSLAILWVNLVSSHHFPLSLQQYEKKGVEAFDVENLLVAVHINHRHVNVIPIWMSLYGHRFKSVYFYAPMSSELCSSISGLQVRCISRDVQGYLAYESAIHASSYYFPAIGDPIMEDQFYHFPFKGVLFIHDDILATRNIIFNDSCSISTGRRFLNLDDNEWQWNKTPFGKRAFEKLNSTIFERVVPWAGRSEFFFVSKKHLAKFIKYGSMMRNAELFSQIAMPTFYSNFLSPTTVQTLHVKESRSGDVVCHGNFDILQGIKLSSTRGLFGHSKCIVDYFTRRNTPA